MICYINQFKNWLLKPTEVIMTEEAILTTLKLNQLNMFKLKSMPAS